MSKLNLVKAIASSHYWCQSLTTSDMMNVATVFGESLAQVAVLKQSYGLPLGRPPLVPKRRSNTYKRFYLSTHASIAVAFTHALPQVQPLAKGSVNLGSSGWQANPIPKVSASPVIASLKPSVALAAMSASARYSSRRRIRLQRW